MITDPSVAGTRGLRGVIHVVHDQEAAGELYTRAGFLVGPPREFADAWVQRDIQVPGFYLSLLSPVAPSIGVPVLSDRTVAPRFVRVYLDGFDGEALEELPGGELSEIPFTPMAGVDHVADPALQRHPNSVDAVAGVVMVANNPSDHHIFLSALTRQRALRATSAGITAQTSRGELSIVDPTAFRGLFGVEPPDVTEEARIGAVRYGVRERGTLIATLSAGAVPYITHMGHVVIAPATAMGATLVFEGG